MNLVLTISLFVWYYINHRHLEWLKKLKNAEVCVGIPRKIDVLADLSAPVPWEYRKMTAKWLGSERRNENVDSYALIEHV